MIDFLCGHFQGLSPFEVLNTDMVDVYNLYVDTAISLVKNKNNRGETRQWVTSKNASWH